MLMLMSHELRQKLNGRNVWHKGRESRVERWEKRETMKRGGWGIIFSSMYQKNLLLWTRSNEFQYLYRFPSLTLFLFLSLALSIPLVLSFFVLLTSISISMSLSMSTQFCLWIITPFSIQRVEQGQRKVKNRRGEKTNINVKKWIYGIFLSQLGLVSLGSLHFSLL